MAFRDDDDSHLHASGPPSSVTEPGEVDIDEENATRDSENSIFRDGSEDSESDGVVSVRGEEVDKDCETPGMWDNVASVRNSEDFGAKTGLEYPGPSINDSVSLMINFGIMKIYLL